MKGVRQTVTAGPDGDVDGIVGNCLQACVASILEVPIHTIPHFAQAGENWEWWAAMRRWAQSEGLDFGVVFDPADVQWGDTPRQWRYLMASGRSPRGSFFHCVVVDEYGALAWDPHPSDDGLVGDPVEYKVLLSEPYEPHPDDQLATLQAESS